MRMWQRWTACGLAVALLGLVVVCWTRAADDEKKPTSGLDAQLSKGLRNAINHGADLYNLNRDFAGCYRVYEGAMLAVRPMLDHRPNLQKTIDTALDTARTTASPVDRCWALRNALDQIRDEVSGKKTEKDKDAKKDDKDKDKPKDADKDKPKDADKDKPKDKDTKDKDKPTDKDKKDADKDKPKDKDAKDKDKPTDKDKP